MTAWDDYLAAAQRLDEVRRDAAVVVASQAGAAAAAAQDLTAVRRRLAPQATRLGTAASRFGIALPPPVPALPGPPGPAAARSLLSGAAADLDEADRLLSEVDSQSSGESWPALTRNLVVYGIFALLALTIDVVLFAIAPREGAGALLTVPCGALLPVLGYGLGLLTTGLLHRGAGRPDRTPLLGAAISAAPVVLLCIGFGAVSILR
jgi:hypothetical protein